jgi:hypothetical protein
MFLSEVNPSFLVGHCRFLNGVLAATEAGSGVLRAVEKMGYHELT